MSNNSFIEPLKLYQYTIYTIGGKAYCSANEFVDTVAHKSGWQIYKEPKPKPPKEPDYVICKLCGGSKSIANPAVSNTSYTTCPKCGGTGYEIKPEPAKEQFKVGDWVRGKSGYAYKITAYPSKLLPDNPNVYDAISTSCMDGRSLCLELSDIGSKLKPSEVVVKIGCLRGTVKRWDSATFHMFHGYSKFSKIHFDALDKGMRELVESLLKAQEEEK